MNEGGKGSGAGKEEATKTMQYDERVVPSEMIVGG